jgi:hypothetical protein
MRKLIIAEPHDTNSCFRSKIQYIFEPFISTIYEGTTSLYNDVFDIKKIEIPTGRVTASAFNLKIIKKKLVSVINSLETGDIIIIIGEWMYALVDFSLLKSKGIFSIVYETEPLTEVWKKPYFFQSLHQRKCPDEIWTYCEYNNWNMKLRKLHTKIKVRTVYPGILKNCIKINQTDESKFVTMSSLLRSGPKDKKRMQVMKFLNEKKNFRENNHSITWYDNEEFQHEYEKEKLFSGVALNLLKTSNIKYGRNRHFQHPLNTASLIRYLSFGLIVVSDTCVNGCVQVEKDCESFKNLVTFSHVYDLPNKLHDVINISKLERDEVVKQNFKILNNNFCATKIIEKIDIFK